MSKMKELIDRLEDIGAKVNPLELAVGKKITVTWTNDLLEVIEIYNSEKELCKNFGMQGILVKQVDGLKEYQLWFDTVTLRYENRLGEELAKITRIIG